MKTSGWETILSFWGPACSQGDFVSFTGFFFLYNLFCFLHGCFSSDSFCCDKKCIAQWLGGIFEKNENPIVGGFLKWWYPTTMGFPIKNDHFGVFWGYHHLRKHQSFFPWCVEIDVGATSPVPRIRKWDN